MATFYVLSDDLIDFSRVTGHGQAAGHQVLRLRDLGSLDASFTQDVAGYFIDLHFPGLDLAAVAQRAALGQPRPRLVGFGSHVHVDILKQARAAGFDEVLPRSAFFEGLGSRFEVCTQGSPTC